MHVRAQSTAILPASLRKAIHMYWTVAYLSPSMVIKPHAALLSSHRYRPQARSDIELEALAVHEPRTDAVPVGAENLAAVDQVSARKR
jgi:hypothetical protein